MIPKHSFVRDLLGRYDMPGIVTDTYEVDGQCNYRVAWPGRSSAHWEGPEALAPVEDAPVMAVFELLYDDCYPLGRAEQTWRKQSC
uniref:Uncharacterized protein n=1 Tax=viral metagenome TaxID=1070528 RepID=A0A6M3JH73_9ZZZZ